MWRSRKSNRFEHSYNQLSDELANKADEAIITLLSSPRPERLGIPKSGSRKGYFAWELGRKCRILYYPVYEQNVVEFFKLCSHDEVYGP